MAIPKFVRQEEYRGGGIAAPSGAPVLITAAEAAAWSHPTLVGLLDAKFATADAEGFVTQLLCGKKTAAGEVQTLAPPDLATAPKLAATTDGQVGIGKYPGAPTNSGSLIGSSNLVLPASPWTFCIVAQEPTGGGGGVLFSTLGTEDQVALEIVSSDQVRLYTDFAAAGAARVSSAVGANDGHPHLWTLRHDGTRGEIYRDGALLASGVIPASVEGVLRLGVLDGGGAFWDGYWEVGYVFASADGSEHNAARAVALERHPGWTIAAL